MLPEGRSELDRIVDVDDPLSLVPQSTRLLIGKIKASVNSRRQT